MINKSNNCHSEYNTENIFSLGPSLLKYLKNKALNSNLKRYRYCLHHSNKHLTQEMIIVFHRDTIITPHRHPIGRSESYHIIEGSMNVYFFDDNGKVIRGIKLGEQKKNNFFYYRLSSHTWHLPVSTSEFMIYHETVTGPFIDESDIEYPLWTKKYDSGEKIKNLINSYKM